jgi:hypothetical protein
MKDGIARRKRFRIAPKVLLPEGRVRGRRKGVVAPKVLLP